VLVTNWLAHRLIHWFDQWIAFTKGMVWVVKMWETNLVSTLILQGMYEYALELHQDIDWLVDVFQWINVFHFQCFSWFGWWKFTLKLFDKESMIIPRPWKKGNCMSKVRTSISNIKLIMTKQHNGFINDAFCIWFHS
jgi:hypothetical protein